MKLPLPLHCAASHTFANFGASVWTYKHRDVLNVPFGWCSITALGEFKAREGGHLVLWEPRKVIEFPHGSTVHIPSATITHSNVPVPEGALRVSFTQYCPGGLFRWVDNGGRVQDELKGQDPAEYERLEALKDRRWEFGLSLLSTTEELNVLGHY